MGRFKELAMGISEILDGAERTVNIVGRSDDLLEALVPEEDEEDEEEETEDDDIFGDLEDFEDIF